MQTGTLELDSLSRQETALVYGIVYLFMHEVIYDALHHKLHNGEMSGEASDAEASAGEQEQALEGSEASNEATGDDEHIDGELYRSAARRELFSPNGIVGDLELMFAVSFTGTAVPAERSQDPRYAQRVQEVIDAQQLSAASSDPFAPLIERAFTKAADRLEADAEAGKLDETDECALCDELDDQDETEVECTGLRGTLWQAICKL